MCCRQQAVFIALDHRCDSLAYEARGLFSPLRVMPHSTQGVASLKALFKGVPLQDVCTAVRWSSLDTSIRFYSLDMDSTPCSLFLLGWLIILPQKVCACVSFIALLGKHLFSMAAWVLIPIAVNTMTRSIELTWKGMSPVTYANLVPWKENEILHLVAILQYAYASSFRWFKSVDV